MVNCLVSIPIDVEVVIVITVFLLAHGSETGAGVFALGQGLLTDIFSGGIWGFYTILNVIIFLFVKIIFRPFDLSSAFGQISIIFIVVLVKEFLQIPILFLFSLNMNFSFSYLLISIVSALSSGLITPLIFYLLKGLCHLFNRVKEAFLNPV